MDAPVCPSVYPSVCLSVCLSHIEGKGVGARARHMGAGLRLAPSGGGDAHIGGMRQHCLSVCHALKSPTAFESRAWLHAACRMRVLLLKHSERHLDPRALCRRRARWRRCGFSTDSERRPMARRCRQPTLPRCLRSLDSQPSSMHCAWVGSVSLGSACHSAERRFTPRLLLCAPGFRVRAIYGLGFQGP
jgi:hypothetical protein